MNKIRVTIKTFFITGFLLSITAGCSSSGISDSNNFDDYDIADYAKTVADNSTKTNYGSISIGYEKIGMAAINGGIAINSGIINVDGTHAIGMYALDGGTIRNEGTINVSRDASYAMRAKGNNSTIVNNGDIFIDDNHPDREDAGILVTDGATVTNYGDIELINKNYFDRSSSNPLSITTDTLSSFVIGTSENGDYGKIKAHSVAINGNIKVDTALAKGEFKDNYSLSNVIEATNINFGKNYTFSSSSFLYDAHSSLNISGGLDATLTRNNNSLATYAHKDYIAVANIFDKYIDKNIISTLNSDQKNVVNKIFENTTNGKSINNILNNLSGNIYSNISRQVLNTNEIFTNKEVDLIENLGENNFNFTVLADMYNSSSKYGIEGYKSQMSGFLGTARLSENLFGTFGYGYNKIDYDHTGSGKLQTIHAGLYKYYTLNEMNLRVGLNSEYNFHETDRDISSLEKKANSDFNSYTVNFNSELSRTYGDSLYIEPTLGLNVGYSSQEGFTETGAGSINLKVGNVDYTSIKPSIGLEIGKKFNYIDIYASSKYFYELGNIDNTQQMSFENFNGEFQSIADHLEGSSTELKIGTSLNYKSVAFDINLGKTFGKRDREFLNAGFSYKF